MSETAKARLAFIGCGSFATSMIFPCIAWTPQIDLVAVCDIDRSKAERNARNFGARRVYTDMNEMLDKEELDGVFVIGPAPQQYQLAPHVLRRGIPVYVEKPSANTSHEAIELAEIAREHGTWGQVGFMKRFAYVYTMAKDVLSREEFGRLRHLACSFCQGPYPQIWGIDSARRAFLIGQCVHLFDLIRFFGGDVRRVQSYYVEADDTRFVYAVNVEFASGAIGQVTLNALYSMIAFRDIMERLELTGEGSNVVCEDMMRVRWQRKEDWTSVVPQTGRYLSTYDPTWNSINDMRRVLGYRGEVEHFALRCLGQRSGGPDLWDSAAALAIGEAVFESAMNGGKSVEVKKIAR